MYHHVSPSPGLVTVSPETFAAQMRHLQEANYTALSAEQFRGFLEGRTALQGKAVLITFDDGFLDNYVYAFPILRRFQLRAVIFAVTGWITDGEVRPCQELGRTTALPPTPSHKLCKAAIREGRADDVMLRWPEIHRMQSAGVMEIHSHTHSHLRWDQLVPSAEKRRLEVRQDLELSQQTLKNRLQRESSHLCWPWGYFEPEYQSAAQAAGFQVQYSTVKGPNMAGADLQRVRRLAVKDRADRWFANRLRIFRHGLLGALYAKLQRQ